MSLRRDLNMYYEGSVLGLRKSDGTISPFYIHGVSGPESGSRLNQFTFYGREVIDSEGNTRDRTDIPYDDLVLELPKLGYVKFGNNAPVWLSYRQRKTVKKGMILQRIQGLRDSNWNTRGFWNMFNPSFTGRANPDLIVYNNEVLYKGVKVGDLSNNVVTLVSEAASYLSQRIEGALQCQVRDPQIG